MVLKNVSCKWAIKIVKMCVLFSYKYGDIISILKIYADLK